MTRTPERRPSRLDSCLSPDTAQVGGTPWQPSSSFLSSQARPSGLGTQLTTFPPPRPLSLWPEGRWIGYGFVAEAGSSERFERDARFELEVDGEPVVLLTDLTGDGPPRTLLASARGWSLPRLALRGCSQGQLALTSDRSVHVSEARRCRLLRSPVGEAERAAEARRAVGRRREGRSSAIARAGGTCCVR